MSRLLTRLTPYADARSWLRGLAVAVAAGVFLAIAGAFGSGELPIGVRLVYWVPLMALGFVLGAVVNGLFFRAGEPGRTLPWREWITASLLMAAPFSLVVWAATRLLLGARIGMSDLPVVFLSVLAVSLVMSAIYILIETRRVVVTPAAPAPPKFLERLPLKLRGAEVWAVEAEDHYLRLHTSKGQELILLRLADAVAELEGLDGMQVHRSWWVARDAIVDAKRSDGRATLTLKDGSAVPVSRTYAAQLRERRWI